MCSLTLPFLSTYFNRAQSLGLESKTCSKMLPHVLTPLSTAIQCER